MNLHVSRWPGGFVGGALCLDFVNTVEYRTPHVCHDRLADYDMILHWCAARKSLPDRAIARLGQHARREPEGAASAWRNCLGLREELRELVAGLRGAEASSSVAAALNARVATLPPLARLRALADGSRFAFDLPGEDLAEPAWPIIWSAAALLTSDQLARLAQCQASPCRHLFIDWSRNGTRQWCDDRCGNRARVRRHKERLERHGPRKGAR